ncbi:MFS transporter [Actinomyces gaoshouyii]|uniref:MFS transporter n=1 Tax=Actinomyces gaoshouyii TaxID=1960083 RepID=A0A8H9H703_9ACTO|nr:MFS transporter [Actinomyces gaoshouyii]ARD42393.1 MFS transporter [Actinomyces gaoshouyii]GGO95562.1 MFS transporter [Actinomyces gaoshouyii]
MPSYRRILREPGALRFSSAALIARFPMSMLGVSLILTVQAVYGSYSAAGAVSAAFVVASAIGSPVLARQVDARGQGAVMRPALAVSASALAALIACLSMRAPLPVVLALAAVAGAFTGSMGSLARSRWTVVLSTPQDLHAAFSLEAALDEVAFVIGPPLATALSTAPALPTASGVIVCTLLQTGGGAWLLSQRATEPPAHPRPRRGPGKDRESGAAPSSAGASRAPVLRHGAVLAVIAVFMLTGGLFGANDVAAVAVAEELGHPSAAGLVLAAWSVGSLSAALVFGARTWGWPLWKQLLAGVTGLAVGCSALPMMPGLVSIAVVMALTGMAIAPTVTIGNNIVQVTVAPSRLTEGLAWIGTALNMGVSLGSLVAGYAIDRTGSHGGYLLVAGFAWMGVLATIVALPTLRSAKVRTDLEKPA